MKPRAVIKYLNAEGCKIIDIHTHLLAFYSDDIMDISNVQRWILRAKSLDKDQTNTYDVPRNGRPVTVTEEHSQIRIDNEIIHKTDAI